MKKLFLFLTLVFSLFLISSCGSEKEEVVQEPETMTSQASLDDVIAATGMNISLPEKIDGYSDVSYEAMPGGTAQATYSDGTDSIIIRKGFGNGDNSEDDSSYAYSATLDNILKDTEVAVKGSDEKNLNTANWTKDDYSYSVVSTKALSVEALSKIISEIA